MSLGKDYRQEDGIFLEFFKLRFQRELECLDQGVISLVFMAFELDYSKGATQINLENFMVIHDLVFKEKIHEKHLRPFIRKVPSIPIPVLVLRQTVHRRDPECPAAEVQ